MIIYNLIWLYGKLKYFTCHHEGHEDGMPNYSNFLRDLRALRGDIG
jgi:hypothetical protein